LFSENPSGSSRCYKIIFCRKYSGDSFLMKFFGVRLDGCEQGNRDGHDLNLILLLPT
jgi:hypothetical protein